MLSTLKATDSARDIRLAGDPDVPVTHRAVVDALRAQAHRAGCELRFRAGSLSRDGADLTVSFGTAATLSDGISHSIGLTTSTAGRRGLRFYAGGTVAEYESQFVAESFRDPDWKYGAGFDVNAACRQAVRWWVDVSRELQTHVLKALKKKDLTAEEASLLLVDAGRAKVVSANSNRVPMMPWSRIGKVDQTYRGLNRQNAWTLIMAFGRVVAMNPPEQQLDQMEGFFKLVWGEI